MSSAKLVLSMPSTNALSRMLCMAAVLLATNLGNAKFNLCVMVLGLMHYMLALVYSRKQFASVMSDIRTAAIFVLVTVGGYFCWFLHFPIAWLSILHHNFNEVYMRDTFQDRNRQTKYLRLSCVVLNVLLFCAILRRDQGLKWIDERFLFGGLIVAALWYFTVLVSSRRYFTTKQLIDNSVYELASFGILVLSMVRPVSIMHLFLYHFLFWEAYPLPKILRSGPAAVSTFVGWHLLFIPIAFLLTPTSPVAQQLGLQGTFVFFAYIHIAMSFGLSTTQPTWLNRLFGNQSRGHASLATVTVTGPSTKPLATAQRSAR